MQRHEEILFVLKQHNQNLVKLNLSFQNDKLARLMQEYKVTLVQELEDLGYTYDSQYNALPIPNSMPFLRKEKAIEEIRKFSDNEIIWLAEPPPKNHLYSIKGKYCIYYESGKFVKAYLI